MVYQSESQRTGLGGVKSIYTGQSPIIRYRHFLREPPSERSLIIDPSGVVIAGAFDSLGNLEEGVGTISRELVAPLARDLMDAAGRSHMALCASNEASERVVMEVSYGGRSRVCLRPYPSPADDAVDALSEFEDLLEKLMGCIEMTERFRMPACP